VNNGPVCIVARAMRSSTTLDVPDRRPDPGDVPPSADRFIGIDLGARSSGNTVVCRRERGLFVFERPLQGNDGDAWLEERITDLRPDAIYIDAPLSLPGAYFGRGADHFFRAADLQARGMSPMFLGGLTARAIRFAQRWRDAGIAVHEVYPAALIRQAWEHLHIAPGKAIPRHKLRLMAGMCSLPPPSPADRHEADAWLCWVIGHRHRAGKAKVFGAPDEGLILA
jgi:predicted nuclease with RNAse H fold